MNSQGNINDIVAYIVLSIGLMSVAIAAVALISYIILLSILPVLMFIPLISVLIVNKFMLKRKLSEFGIAINKIDLKYIAPAIIYPFIIIGLSIPIAYAIGVKVDWTLSQLFSELAKQSQLAGIPYEALLMIFMVQIVIAPFFNAIFAFGEESGWRGYLLTRFEEEFGLEQAIILSGFIWGLWHWPLILAIGYDYTYETRYIGAIIFLVFTIAIGVFLSWLRIKTGNVLMPALAHGAINAYIGFGTYLFITDRLTGYPAGALSIVSECIIAAIIWYYLFYKKKSVNA